MGLTVTTNNLNFSCKGNDSYQPDASLHTRGLLKSGHKRYWAQSQLCC